MALLALEPHFVDYIWGSEIWQIAARPDGSSRVKGGALLVEWDTEALVGASHKTFPLLLKTLRAKHPLSLQVHPDAAMAAECGGEPKEELWIAVKPSSALVGLRSGYGEEGLTDPRAYVRYELSPGDLLSLPAGVPHALLGGSEVLEIQQNSNTTYRLFDWDRNRPLQLDLGKRAYRSQVKPVQVAARRGNGSLFQGSCFTVEQFTDPGELPSGFALYTCRSGEGRLKTDGEEGALKEGESLLVTASACGVSWEGTAHLYRFSLKFDNTNPRK